MMDVRAAIYRLTDLQESGPGVIEIFDEDIDAIQSLLTEIERLRIAKKEWCQRCRQMIEAMKGVIEAMKGVEAAGGE